VIGKNPQLRHVTRRNTGAPDYYIPDKPRLKILKFILYNDLIIHNFG